ncbi:(Fe-S)-binding protein [candidate division KSB1 bacterium]|nr:MAG: (Fe-S)-binding protein [candidate division KSB1 bacterium]
MNIEKIIDDTKAYFCIECGICTGSCPISRIDSNFSPRLMVENLLLGEEDDVIRSKKLWSCLTCKACSSRCPASVDFNQFIMRSRIEAKLLGENGTCTHAGTLKAMMELQTTEFFRKSKEWIPENFKVTDRGKFYYFVGCLPFFNIIFKDINVKSIDIAVSALKIFNFFGIEPVISENERCCGHDHYWIGEFDVFKTLAEYNLKTINNSGAEVVFFTCPEGYNMFKEVYPLYFGKLDFECVYLPNFVNEKLRDGDFSFLETEDKVTYQDPCRLGRFMGIYEEPRNLIQNIPGIVFKDMPRNRANSLCCGSSNWINCTSVNKLIQVERLKEAENTGAETLITGCPKCEIHLNCALFDRDNNYNIRIKDITTLIAEKLGGK